MFPEAEIDDFLFEVKYDGPSFEGIMEIHALGNELLGFETCIQKVVSALKRANKIELGEGEYEIVVEGFENNCFKKRIKIIAKNMNKYPVAIGTATAITATVIGSVVTIILHYQPAQIKEMSPQLMQQIGDNMTIQLLQDKDFLKALSSTVKPLVNEQDKMTLRKPVREHDRDISIDYSQKSNFEGLLCDDEVDEEETIRHDEVFGRIISMDLDAIVNQIDFKVAGAGERIHCSVAENLNINDYTSLLGKWVTLTGSVTEKGEGKITHIQVDRFTEEEPPESEMKQSKLFQ